MSSTILVDTILDAPLVPLWNPLHSPPIHSEPRSSSIDRLGLYKLLCGEERRALSLHCYSAVAIVIKQKMLFTNNNQPNYGTIMLLNMILGAPSHHNKFHNKLDKMYVLFRSMYNIRST